MNLPNRLTVVRILLTFLFFVLIFLDFPFHTLAAALVFAVAAITDLLDGIIARRDGLVTDLGKFLDPIADKILTTSAFIAFLALDHMNPWALLLILIREFAVSSVRLMAAGNGTVVAANLWGKIKTVMQYIAILFMMAAMEFASWEGTVLSGMALPHTVFSIPLVIGEVLIWVAAVATAVSGIQYLWLNRRFFLNSK